MLSTNSLASHTLCIEREGLVQHKHGTRSAECDNGKAYYICVIMLSMAANERICLGCGDDVSNKSRNRRSLSSTAAGRSVFKK